MERDLPALESADEPVSERALPVDIAPRDALIEVAPCDSSAVAEIQRELTLSRLIAETLVRRGHETPAAVREWISSGRIHPPSELPGAPEAAAVIASHLELGSRIAVHGDYDVDGVSSTAILVRALVSLGADVTWHVPSRFDDGYGLTRGSVERLSAAGAELIVAVDCGIGSVDEVALAKSLGVDVVICDHHTIGERLPDAPIVHPGLGGYPDPWLCAAAATHKLASLVTELAGGDQAGLDRDLALVGLATVCDVVPLRGENRALVRAGIEAMRATQSPGLRELMRVAGIDRLKLGAEAFGFGLGPRINAAGRMYSADPAVELLLTESQERAAELAGRLAAANQQRREVEQRVLEQAEVQAREQRGEFAIVVAGHGWHPGVLGIAAGRLAERYRRPVVALTLEEGVASGSARAGGSYDLHAGLTRCAALLTRYGGHPAAAGLALDEINLVAFRRALAADAAAELSVDDLRPRASIDALGRPADINLSIVGELEALGPFGAANPQPQVLIAGADLVGVATMGKSGNHYKLTLEADGTRANVVAFRQDRAIDRAELPRQVDVVVELQRNEFNGREEAQAVMRVLVERGATAKKLWREDFERALCDPPFAPSAGLDEARTHDRRGEPLSEVLSALEAEGARVCVAVNCIEFADQVPGNTRVYAYDDPRLADEDLEIVVMAEPPPAPGFIAWEVPEAVTAWSADGVMRLIDRAGDLLLTREHTVATYRCVAAAAGELAKLIDELRSALPSARIAGRALRVLEELDIVSIERSGEAVDVVKVNDSPRTELERSLTFRSYSGYREESEPWLRQLSAEIN